MSTTSSSTVTSSPLGTLYLLPVTLGDDRLDNALPAEVLKLARTLDTFVVENEKTARRFLSLIKTDKPVRELTLLPLNEHTEEKALPELLKPLLQGRNVGIMSEAGCPGIADPGARLVELAHRKSIKVVPLVGPSSILLSLMASGLDGQRFSFHGYLPSDKAARIQRLKELERESQKWQQTQLFIETPYRNQHMLEDILAQCQGTTRLCVATNISLSTERIVTKTISEWKRHELPDIHRQPTVFLLLAADGR
ncbi:SAM-dependent methyltransferase [Methylovorus sp. MP688]|uniref:SAM-dependent methyltransferase n=1 Tax=Methylovorus sp. (strain MP688) TaxID=887061 RepID=UPI0001EC4704|nr:SAM-dependent methyltransferase [Methylovorus sp. MP688]ADQ84628.1 Uroporphyrin-III C/tetrapyrrole (Corrin/Porphyrin) methyltransferase [Methylovorus sp. MP688]